MTPRILHVGDETVSDKSEALATPRAVTKLGMLGDRLDIECRLPDKKVWNLMVLPVHQAVLIVRHADGTPIDIAGTIAAVGAGQ